MNCLPPFPFTDEDLASSLPLRFYKVLQQLPAAHLAYVGADATLTYRELAAASQGVAATLLARLGQARTRAEQQAVALFLPHTAASLIGIGGVLQTGHFFVPLDLVMGEATNQKILADCPPQVILTTAELQTQLAQMLPPDQAPPILCIETIPPIDGVSSLPLPAEPQLYASIQYTSGSTGMPRGVIRTHATHLNTGHLANSICALAPDDHVSHLLSYSLSLSNASLFGCLLNGATLYPQRLAEMTPFALYQWIKENQISQLGVSVGMLRRLADLAETHPPLPSLRVIASGGEVMQRAEVEALCRLLPAGGKLVLRLASTEAGAYANCIIEAGKPWPGNNTAIGTLPLNHQVLIVDENRQRVPFGQPGEIAVRGRFLSAGYWQRPVESAAKFRPDPDDSQSQIFFTGDTGRMSADGRLEFLGRTDFLVKIRGYRVQLEEVEAALTTLPMVQAAVVVAQPVPSGDKQLVAYLVPRSQPEPTTSALRQALSTRLPVYMIPTRFKLLDALPMTPNGKVDRRALPPLGNARPALDTPFVAPQSELECVLAGMWANLLELEAIGIHDNFFEVGGHSLLAMRLLHEIEQQFQQKLPVQPFMATPTIAHSAALLAAALDPHATDVTVAAPPAADGQLQAIYNQLGQPGLLQKLQRQTPSRGPVRSRLGRLLRPLPYAARLRTLHWLVRQPWARQRYWQPQIRLIRDFYAVLDTPVDEETMITNSLFYDLQRHYQLNEPYQTTTPPAQLVWDFIEVAHLERFAQAKAQAHGVILTWMHTIANPWLRPLAWVQSMIGDLTVVLQHMQLDVQASKPLFVARQLEVARQTLQRGEVVGIVPDGHLGDSIGLVRPFHGRQRTFFTGFAELALLTDAPILVVMAEMQPGRKVKFRFAEPLDTGVPGMSHAARVEQLMAQYLVHLDQLWRTMPWMIPPPRMAYHLACPRLRDGS